LDPRLAVPSVAIPFGQRFINLTLASREQMVDYLLRGPSPGTGGFNIHSNIAVGTPVISTLELYINNIFVNPEIHMMFIKRIGFTLIRVHRTQVNTITTANAEILLNSMKWPIETMFVGLRPTLNGKIYNKGAAGYNPLGLAQWHLFSQITPTNFTLPNVLSKSTTVTTAAFGVATPVTAAIALATAFVQTATITNVTVSAHSVLLYNDFPSLFFNAYCPLMYGGHNIRCPEDRSVMMIPFNLYPGTYQPSGHINVSRAREFYFKFNSTVSGNTECELVVVASAINFLLISDGSAVLRYTT